MNTLSRAKHTCLKLFSFKITDWITVVLSINILVFGNFTGYIHATYFNSWILLGGTKRELIN